MQISVTLCEQSILYLLYVSNRNSLPAEEYFKSMSAISWRKCSFTTKAALVFIWVLLLLRFGGVFVGVCVVLVGFGCLWGLVGWFVGFGFVFLILQYIVGKTAASSPRCKRPTHLGS